MNDFVHGCWKKKKKTFRLRLHQKKIFFLKSVLKWKQLSVSLYSFVSPKQTKILSTHTHTHTRTQTMFWLDFYHGSFLWCAAPPHVVIMNGFSIIAVLEDSWRTGDSTRSKICDYKITILNKHEIAFVEQYTALLYFSKLGILLYSS